MIRKKLKVALFTFLGIAGLGLVSGIFYLQSESFANSVKKMISARSPQKLGVVGDFSNLKLYFFPPGIGVASPTIQISKENISQIPIDAHVEAKELRVSFAPIQMFSGVLQVSEIYVMGGAIQGTLFANSFNDHPKKKSSSGKLNWRDLFELQVNGFRLEDTYLNLVTKLPGSKGEELGTELVVKNLLIKKSRIEDHDGIVSSAVVSAVRVVPPASMKSLPIREANQLQWDVEWTNEGLKLNPFTADLSGIHLQLDGAIKGNLLDEKSNPTFEADAQIQSDLGTFFLANLNDSNWDGVLKGRANISTLLNKPVENLRVKFSVETEKLKWKEIHAQKMAAVGDLDLSNKKLLLKSLEAEDDGLFKISSTEIPLDLGEAFQTELDLKDADIHWLGGAVSSDVKPLEGKLTGKIRAQFVPQKGNGWHLRTEEDLVVSQFQLRSNHAAVLRPTLPLKLIGECNISSKGIDFKDFKVSMNKTELSVTGGVHSNTEGGFALLGKGAIDLKEMNQIAENDVRGEGDISVSVHGPASNVLIDFTPHLKNASYLGMHFGNLDGKLTYDDGVSEIRFVDIHANYKNTFYSLDEGFIDLSGGDDIKLPFEIHSGKIEDIGEILDSVTHKISWYPRSLKGEMHGSVLVGGKFTTPKLKVLGELEGSDWQWLGERARKVKMSIGFDEGNYYAKNVIITKTTGALKGDIAYSKDAFMKWHLSTENLSFLDIDLLDRLGLPIKSKIELKSEGEGPLDHLKSKSEGNLTGTEFKGEGFEASKLTLDVGESTLRANVNIFGDKLVSQLKYALIPKQPSSFRLDLNNFDFSPALLIINPKLLDDVNLVGVASGHVDLDFLSTQAEFARGDLQFKKYRLEKTGFSLVLQDPVNVPVQLGYFHFPPARLKFNHSELVMAGDGMRGEIDFSLKGQTDLAIAELFSSSIASASGKADTEIRIRGPLKNLSLSGDVNFSNARILMKWLQTPFESLDGAIRLRQGSITVQHMDGFLGEEPFSLSGKIQTFTDRFPALDLRAQMDGNKIKMLPLDMIQVRGLASIHGEEPPYLVSGNLEVPQALWAHGFGSTGGTVTSRGDRFLPVDDEKQISSNLFMLDFNINAPQGFLIKNEILDGEFRGKVKLTGAPDHPILMGEGSLVQGKVFFKDHSFVLDNVKVDFDDPYQLNPKFNASATSDVNQYKIRLLAYGRSNTLKAEFSSTPFLPESEIFSLLASGYTSADASRYKTRDRSYVSQGEAASLILHSMDFSKDVQNKTGFQFDVQEAVDNNSATSIFRPQNLADNVAAPKVVLKRQLGRSIWFSVGSTVGVGTENQKEVNAEYKLTPAMSALGVWNDTEDNSSTTIRNRTSFGLDLKFNRRFK